MSTHKKIKTENDVPCNLSTIRSSQITSYKRKNLNQIHVGLQDRLEKEMKIRDGATRLMAACTHETQLLVAAKTLHTSNARTFAYMAELQKIKATEVMEAIMDEPGWGEGSRVSKGRIAISDIRIPLMWKNVLSSSKSKDHNRHAVFCLLATGSEIQDTELVCVDKTTTDISFSGPIIFENVCYDFKLLIEVFAFPMSNDSVSAATPEKLLSRLNRSIGKLEGKHVREHMRENAPSKIKNGRQYEKIGSLVLTLGDVSDDVRSHDLDLTNQHHLSLLLYESITCKLAAQPKCVTDISTSGFLHTLHMVGAVPNWSYVWCEVKAGLLKGWKNPESSNQPPQFIIDLLPKDVKINEIEKIRQKRPNSFQVRDTTDRYIFAAGNKEDMIKWVRGMRQHRSDHGAWSNASFGDDVNRAPMFIPSPPPKQTSSDLMFERGLKTKLVYDQLGIDPPLKQMKESLMCSDLLNDKDADSDRMVAASVQSALLEKQATTAWAGLFTGLNRKAVKMTRNTDISANSSMKDENFIPPSTLREGQISRKNTQTLSCSEASGSDDAFLTDSDDNAVRRKNQRLVAKKSPAPSLPKKKRRAPLSPWDNHVSCIASTPQLPSKQKLRKNKREILSSGSSYDGATEQGNETRNLKPAPVPKPRSCRAKDKYVLSRGVVDYDDVASVDSIHSGGLSQSSGYKSETESNGSRVGERIWAKQRSCETPNPVTSQCSSGFSSMSYHHHEQTQSLDAVDDAPSDSGSGSVMVLPSGDEVVYAELEKCRPQTHTVPETPPSSGRLGPQFQPPKFDPISSKPPTPTPRRSYLSAIQSPECNPTKNHNLNESSSSVSKSSKFIYRQLPFDPTSNAYRQAGPPALPPKMRDAASSPQPHHCRKTN